MEEYDLVRFRKELWTMTARQREEKGRCFANMVLVKGKNNDLIAHNSSYVGKPSTSSKLLNIRRHTYCFARVTPALDKTQVDPSGSLLNGHMAVGDAITVSIEPALLAFTRGFILELLPDTVTVGVDHALDTPLLAQRNCKSEDEIVFRIDKDELFAGMGRIRANLANLFYLDGDRRTRERVVDLALPRFDDPDMAMADAILASARQGFASPAVTLNAGQNMAMARCISAKDYALVLGMPGTGKTTLVAALIRTLARMGKTVLLTSYTHSAVDTILLKLLNDSDFGILRLGNVDKVNETWHGVVGLDVLTVLQVHPDIQQYTLSSKQIPTTIEQMEHQIMTPAVVATTCLSIDQ